MTKAEDEFRILMRRIGTREIQPMSFIERIYVRDIAVPLWEIIRLRRFKPATLNNALRVALSTFSNKSCSENPDYELEAEAFRLTSSEIDRLDRVLTVAEIRRDSALHCIADCPTASHGGLRRAHRRS
jgi:hypothetical protein